MKTPDIPQECGLYSWNGGIVTDDPKIGAHAFRVSFDTRSEIGRAALAAYCMAVIDVLRIEAFEMKFRAEDENEIWFWEQTEGALLEWRAELSRYGGFTR